MLVMLNNICIFGVIKQTIGFILSIEWICVVDYYPVFQDMFFIKR